MKILLAEPPYRTDYPPLGLLKISRFHKERGDSVDFVKGLSAGHASLRWDRVYVSSLFTCNWTSVVRTLRFYSPAVEKPSRDLFAGGPLASLLGHELERAVSCRAVKGIIDSAARIGLEGGDIDALLPDYNIIADGGPYACLKNAYIASATRGCPARCEFCSVREVDPRCVEYLPVAEQIANASSSLGKRDNIIFLDNNVAQSPFLDAIVEEILSAGFGRGERKGWVDFSQGFEPALFSGRTGEKRADSLSRLPLSPVRLAWDALHEKEIYSNAVAVFASRGFSRFSTPLLYGFSDSPSDMFFRLEGIVSLERDLGISIQGIPMGYVGPLRKRRPSGRERAAEWGISEQETLEFLKYMKKVPSLERGNLDQFYEIFGSRGEVFQKKLGSGGKACL